jgi:DNA-binding PadR family transcriptional regulator
MGRGNQLTLSKTSLFVLGIIADSPINPYAISKLVNHKRRNFRKPIHTQTIYSIVNALHKKKLISGRKTKSGRMPDRIIYSITTKGRELLRGNIVSYLGQPEETLSELLLSILVINQLDRETVLMALKGYQNTMNKEIASRNKLNAEEMEHRITYINRISLEHTFNILNINLDTVNKLIKEIEMDTQWEPSPIPYWRNEIS